MEQIATDLRNWTDRAGVPMLVGTIRYDHLRGSEDRGATGLKRFNAAILFEPGRRALHFYHKMHLVPFGEYFPLIESLPWLRALTPYRGEKLHSLSTGSEPVSLPLGPYRLAVSICFEDTIPHVIRQSFAQPDAALQPDVLINLSNDGWFHGSAELDMHLAIGVFRAIENRVPLGARSTPASRRWSTATARFARPWPRRPKACFRSRCRWTSVRVIIRNGVTGSASLAWPSRSAWCLWDGSVRAEAVERQPESGSHRQPCCPPTTPN